MSLSPEVSRIFVGTFLSVVQQQALAELRTLQEHLSQRWHKKIRWVKAKKLHLTWLFLGDVEKSLIPEIKRRLQEIADHHERFEVTYDYCEFWPSNKKARQLVLVPQVISPAVASLAKDIRSELSEFATKRDDRQFSPHITLMRLDHLDNKGSGSESGQLPAVSDLIGLEHYVPLVHKIDAMSLIESHLGSQNDDYLALERFLLRTL